MKKCTIDACEKAVVARGWCSMHYSRWRSHGDPEIALTNKVPYDQKLTDLGVKVCPKCSTVRSFSCFARDSRAKDGHQSHCKSCNKDYRKANKERISENNRKYFIEHEEELREYGRKYNQQYVVDNPDKIRSYRAKRRAIEAGAPAVDPGLTWRKVADRDGMLCRYCSIVCNPEDRKEVVGKNGRRVVIAGLTHPSLDHVIPLSRGGNHTLENSVLACRSCNARKWAN